MTHKISFVTRTAMILLTAALVAGCATTKTDQSQYMRDGVQYGQHGKTAEGKKQGTFRGRWWSYYVRGRSYLDGQFYAEAESDMRTALAKRTKDQRWARTYGLHFIPEYFPNRELGIVLYNTEDYEEAINFLEMSNEQTPSARAAYFLDQSRSQHFSSADQSPPVVTFASQNASGSLSANSILLKAQVSDDTFVRSILVNGQSYPIQVSGKTVDIETEVALSAGANTISVTATDISGKSKTYTLDIIADHDGPAISFDRPINLPGRLSGAVSDPSGVASLQIAGLDATLAAGGSNVSTFSVDITEAQLNSANGQGLLFTANDQKGNSTSGPVRLFEGDVVALDASSPGGIIFASNSQSVKLGNGLIGLMQNGKVAAVMLAATDDTLTKPEIQLTNAIQGQRYRLEEIILGMRVRSSNPIDKVIIDGIEVDTLVPGRNSQTISRRVPLPNEQNTVKIEVIDSAGEQNSQEFTIVREFTEIHLEEHRLNLAILGNYWAGTAPDDAQEADYITRRLKDELTRRNRFRLVSDSDLEGVVEEQELIAAFGDKQSRQAISQALLSAEVLVVGKIHKSFDSIEVVLEAIDPVSSSVIGYADVAGPGNTRSDLQALTNYLALRFQQMFPVATGQVTDPQNQNKIQTSLNESHGVTRNIRCIVYRRSPEQFHAETGESLGFNTEIIANGFLNDVRADQSVLTVLQDGELTEITITENDLVVTK